MGENIQGNKQDPAQMEKEVKALVNYIVGELVAERKRQGVTQQEIAEITGIKTPNVTRIESCRYTPTLNVLLRYAKALGKEIRIDLGDILTEGE